MHNMLYNGGTQVHDVNIEGYSEPDALQCLLVNLDKALENDTKRFEQKQGNFVSDQFTISIFGVTCAFMVGAPQADALCRFVKSICDENLYEVDIEKNVVKGW